VGESVGFVTLKNIVRLRGLSTSFIDFDLECERFKQKSFKNVLRKKLMAITPLRPYKCQLNSGFNTRPF